MLSFIIKRAKKIVLLLSLLKKMNSKVLFIIIYKLLVCFAFVRI